MDWQEKTSALFYWFIYSSGILVLLVCSFFLIKSVSRDQVLSQWSSKNNNEVVKFQELRSVSRFNTGKQNNIWAFICHPSTIRLLPHLSANVAGFPLQIPQEEKNSQSFMEQVATGIFLWGEKLMWTRSYCQCSTFNLLLWFDTTGFAMDPRELLILENRKNCFPDEVLYLSQTHSFLPPLAQPKSPKTHFFLVLTHYCSL